MQRLDRHDKVFISRRKRARAVRNQPRPWVWLGQSVLMMVTVVLVASAVLVGSGVAVVYGVYKTYAAQLPDASVIESQQEEFETVRIYDRTGRASAVRKRGPATFPRRPHLCAV